MNPIFWAAVLTTFTAGAPGKTSSVLEGVHYTNEAACIASVHKDYPSGAVRLSDGSWLVESCVKVDPQAYLMTDDGEHVTPKPGINGRATKRALCAAARKVGDTTVEQNCPRTTP